MWNTLLGINSFIIGPATAIFLVYATFRGVFFLSWKVFWLAVVLSIVVIIAEVILAIMSE